MIQEERRMYLYLYFNPDKFSDDSKALNRKLPLKRNFRKARTGAWERLPEVLRGQRDPQKRNLSFLSAGSHRFCPRTIWVLCPDQQRSERPGHSTQPVQDARCHRKSFLEHQGASKPAQNINFFRKFTVSIYIAMCCGNPGYRTPKPPLLCRRTAFHLEKWREILKWENTVWSKQEEKPSCWHRKPMIPGISIIYTFDTDLKNRLRKFGAQHPDLCKLNEENKELGISYRNRESRSVCWHRTARLDARRSDGNLNSSAPLHIASQGVEFTFVKSKR